MKDIEEMTEKEFKSFMLKREGHRKNFKVTNSWGVYDAYKAIRKNKWYNIGRPLKEHEFYSIIRKVNNYLAESLYGGNIVIFPHRMGSLRVYRKKSAAKIIDGKLRITNPINWDATLSLWFRDKEAMKNKTLVRYMNKCFYFIIYSKKNAVYKNIGFYSMQINRFLLKELSDRINKGQINTLW